MKPLRFGVKYNHDNYAQDEKETDVDIKENIEGEESIQAFESSKWANENDGYLQDSNEAEAEQPTTKL